MSRNRKRTLIVFYDTYSNGPWDCYFCGLTVLCIGQKTWDGNVHHVDGDKSNDAPENLVMTHTICHQQHHAPTDEQKVQISQKLKGRPSPTKGMKFSAEVNAKKAHHGPANHQYGKPLPQHTRDAISQANRRRVTCDLCGIDIAKHWVKRHQEAGCKPLRVIDIDGVKRVRGKLPKTPCPDCGKPYAERWMQRHKNAGQCV